jgi:(p)ppGpp synthase/HD superfamily hydrolase
MDEAISETAGVDEARAFVEEAYRARSAEDGKSAEHPLAAARLLRDEGEPPHLVVAGLLHDVLEDTGVNAGEVKERFGPEVTRLVQALTQDPSISDYGERKAALRRQILEAGRDAATVALADKTAKLGSERARPKDIQLDHYRATLRGIEERYGRSSLSERLRRELQRFPAG